MSWCFWARLCLLLSIALSVAAQASNVTTCIPAYRWSINSRKQTPCLVASYLATACGTPTRVDSIPPGNHYVGPIFATADVCKCSTAYYSMMSACGGCQGLAYSNWTAWSMNCPEAFISLQRFERPIPDGTTVPDWAFLDVVASNNNFNATAAQLAIGLRPTTSIVQSSTTSDPPSTTIPSPALTSLPPSQTPAAEKSSVNPGAIAGGVVGGLVGVAAIALGILWFCTRKRNAVQRDITFDHQALVGPGSVVGGGSIMTTQYTGQTNSPDHGPTISYGPSPFTSSPYETSEMSTYPGSPMTSAVYTTLPVNSQARRSLESVSPSLAQLGPAPGYTPNRGFTGTAEI